MNLELPPHKAGLFLYHNTHKNYHESAAGYLDNGETSLRWPSEEARRRAIETDEIWELIWHPETPIGSHYIAAPTLAELLEFAKGFE